MPSDPNAYRENAKQCLKLAAAATDPVLKDSLMDAAQGWERLAVELESDEELLPFDDRPYEQTD